MQGQAAAKATSVECIRLKAEMIAISEETRTIVNIPARAEVILLEPFDRHPERNKQVGVEWRGQALKVFAVDLQDRAEKMYTVVKTRNEIPG